MKTMRGLGGRIWPQMLAAMLMLSSIPVARCEPVTAARLSPAPDDPTAYLVDGAYLRDEKRIAAMRANGDLPDTISDGKCTFGIAGDPGVVYYARECP